MNKLNFTNFKLNPFNAINYLLISVLLTVFVFPRNAAALNIEPYDFKNFSGKVEKVWNPEVALYVAQQFATEHGFDDKTVSVKKLNAGASNHFVYLMFIDNQLKFVIKGVGTQKEAESLFALQNYPKIQDIQNNPESAIVCLSHLIKFYTVKNDNHHYYFAILEAAQGKELFKIMTDGLLYNKDINQLKEIFYTIGRQTSELHKTIIGANQFISPKNLTSVIHDDFHPENTFYNLPTKKFSLIDNDSLGETISNPMPLLREMYGIYEIPMIRWPAEKITIDLLKDADPHDIASIYFEFIKGMSSVYKNPEEAKIVFTESIITLNNRAIAFLKDNNSEPWMQHPTDKSEDHIVWGKLSKAINNPFLTELYISKLSIINSDLKSMAKDYQ